ncbi:MAG: hypothetical protein DRP01_04200, partial [Archaeoglobales archaeon]
IRQAFEAAAHRLRQPPEFTPEAYEAIKEVAPEITIEQFAEAIEEAGIRYEYAEEVARLGWDEYVPEELWVETDFNYRTPYQALFWVECYDKETGRDVSRVFTFGYEGIVTKGQAYEEFTDILDILADEYEIDVASVHFIGWQYRRRS